jgi:hypothetical protein
VLLAAAGVLDRPPRRMIVSGVLCDEADEVASAFGLRERRRIAEEGWAAVVLG